MKLALRITAAGFTAILLASCGSTGSGSTANHPSGTGPFDSRGNYVEDWADSPSKWKRGPANPSPSKPGDSLVLANNDEPPANSVPIPTPSNTPQPGEIASKPVISRPVETAPRREPTNTVSKPKVPAPTVSKPKPKPKPTVAVKVKPKKPMASRYTIRKGDTLSAIAARNNTSVAAIQRANGIKGSLIQPGKTLVIPR